MSASNPEPIKIVIETNDTFSFDSDLIKIISCNNTVKATTSSHCQTSDQRKIQKLIVTTFNKMSLNNSDVSKKYVGKKKKLASGEIPFICGNPTVETVNGIVHYYKISVNANNPSAYQESTVLCMFGIPVHLTVKEILAFTFPMRETIKELKIVRNDVPDRYMALLSFINKESANKFFEAFNNTLYNNIETDKCQLIYVSNVEIISLGGAGFPSPNYVELPSCPVCLERMDEPVNGILTTILCNHTFHDGCISQVEDTTCPVCRYMQSPEAIDSSQCSECNLRENLWICLICGNIGCGRSGRGHALRHFETTGHTFSLELGKQLVWDYADDTYVHRLAMNHEDGKLVQIGEGSETGDKKMDILSMDFGAILTCQLESQRMYFENELARVTTDAESRTLALETKFEDLKKVSDKNQSKLCNLLKENEALNKRLAQSTELARHLQSELNEERTLNKSLLSNQVLWKERAEKAEKQEKETKEELQDLMLNLQLRDKFTQAAQHQDITEEELVDGAICIGQSEVGKAKQRRQKKKR